MYTFESRIRYSEVDSEGRLTMAALINYLQDCSTFQSEDLGLGVEYLKKAHLVWVLCSWQIVVERFPVLGEKVTTGTQPYDLKGFLGYRNFAMLDEKGNFLAKANSLWSLLDTETGRPTSVPEIMVERYTRAPKLEMDYSSRKIAVPEGSVRQEPLTVKKHHLDTNHHVNNQQFLDMAMDFLPEGFCVAQVRAEYKKQAFLQDVLVPWVAEDGSRTVVKLADETGGAYMIAEFLRKEQA